MSLDDDARALLTDVMTPKRRARARIAEPLRDAQSFEVDTPHGKVAAWRLGEGPAVLCVHGWQDDNALWSPLIQALSELGMAAVALDLPGHGHSQGNQCTPIGAGEAIKAVAAQLGPIDSVVTHSFGGPATSIAMNNGLNVRRAVLIASPRGRNKRWFHIAEQRGISQAVVERARELYAAEIGAAQAKFDLAEVAKGFNVEALIIHSLDDDAVEWDNAQAIADAWPGAELVLCDGLGHRMIAQDRAIIERVVQFVA